MKYTSTYITNVILRLDIINASIIDIKDFPESIYNKCKEYFPIPEIRSPDVRDIKLSINDNDVKVESSQIKNIEEWHYFSKDRYVELTIASNAIIMSSKIYDGFKDFKRPILEIIQEILNSYKNIKIGRIGLRYINQINIDDRTTIKSLYSYWSKYINPDLIKQLNFIKDETKICRAMNKIELNTSDSMINFQYGIFNEDYPAPIKKKSYIIDIDAYLQGITDLSESSDIIEKLHSHVVSLFEESIREPLRNKMGKSNEK